MEDFEDWLPARAIEELTVMRALQDVEDPVKMANQIIRETLPVATMRMRHLALHEQNPTVAYNAAKYFMDRAMGAVTSPNKPESEAPAWQKIFDSIAVIADTKAE